MNRKKSQYYNSLRRLEDISKNYINNLNNKNKQITNITTIIFLSTFVVSITILYQIINIALITSFIINTLSTLIAIKLNKNINIQKNALEKFKEFINLEMIIENEKNSSRSILENYKLASSHSNKLYNGILIGNNKLLLEITQEYDEKCKQNLIIIENIKSKNIDKKENEKNINNLENKQNNKLCNNLQYEKQNIKKNDKQYIKQLKHLY